MQEYKSVFLSIQEYHHALLNFDAGKMQGWVSRYCGNRSAAPELLQDVYVELLQADLAQVQGIRDFEPYLHGVCKHIGVNYARERRKAARLISRVESFPQPVASTPEVAVNLIQALACVNNAIRALSIRRRRVFVLRHVFGYSTRETAKIRNRDESTIGRTLCDAMNAIVNTMSRESDAGSAHSILRQIGLEK
jgi:RNA polymerase sigma factor (sigma-70 family)